MALITTNKGQFVIWCPMNIALEQPGNVNMFGTSHDGDDAPWFYPYDGKKSVISNLPNDWTV
jgi:hypothetical protein